MTIGSRSFNLNERPVIMGILNITPDSFSDGGKYKTMDAALRQAEDMLREGADIIDVGGESTRPGHEPVDAAEETARVVPVLEAIRQRFDTPLSVDTYKASVAEAAVLAGADLINDIWGFKADPAMAKTASRLGVACCLMHNRHDMDYGDFIPDMLDDLRGSISLALEAGVREDRIIIDPGLGFAKNYEHNLIVMNNLEKLLLLGYPVLLGASRKRFVGQATGVAQAAERDIGTAATTAIGVMKGCRIIRVHNVAMNRAAALMADHVIKAGGYNG
jgi:dihydropteroate synthase